MKTQTHPKPFWILDSRFSIGSYRSISPFGAAAPNPKSRIQNRKSPTLPLLAALTLLAAALATTPTPAPAADIHWGGGAGAITDDNWYSTPTPAPAAKVTRTTTDTLNLPSGTLTIAATATAAETGIGTAPGAHAAVIVNAPGGYWNNTSGELSIGGSAASTIAAGTPTNVSGALTILSGSVRANTLYIGNYGSGALHLAQGAALTNTANAFLARNPGGSGAATIDGSWTIGATGASNGYLYIGSAAATGARSDNTLTIGPTGTVTVAGTGAYGYIRIGSGIGTTGTLIVRGLLQTKSATATNAIGYAGNNRDPADAPATGVLTIAPTGTVIFSGSETTLGHFGIGSSAAYRANATGAARVDGVWHNAGALIVGRSGHGHLEIGPTGTVTVGAALTIALYNSASNASHTAAPGPEGGALIVDGHLTIGDHAIIGAGDATARLHIGANGTLRTGTNAPGAATGYLQIGRNGSTAGSGAATPVPGAATLQVDGLLDIDGHLHLGQRSKTELTIGSEGIILVAGNHYQSANTLLAFTPAPAAPARDLPLIAIAGAAHLSGTLAITALDNLAGYTTAAAAPASSALPHITIISAAAGIEGDFTTLVITPAPADAPALPDYIYYGRTILPGYAGEIFDFGFSIFDYALPRDPQNAPAASPSPSARQRPIENRESKIQNPAAVSAAEYRVGHHLAWHAPAPVAHGVFTIPAAATFTIDTPLADRPDAPALALATGWDGRSLTKRGPGALTLAAPATRTGDTTIESGTLRLALPSAALGHLVNNATLDLGGSSTGYHTATAATLAGTGTLILAASGPADDAPGDRLIITGNAAGAHAVLVSINNAAPTPATAGQLAALITITGSNTATFNPSAPPSAPTVTFAPQGGAVTPAQQPVTPDAPYGPLPTPTHPTATFAGWYTAPNATGTQVTPETIVPPAAGAAAPPIQNPESKIQNPIILYARWLPDAHPLITPATDIAPANDLYGSIVDDTGAPVPDVVVSDGFQCVTTDARGIYQMKRHPKARIVFYSTPATHAINTLAPPTPTARQRPIQNPESKIQNPPGAGYAWFSQKLTPHQNHYNFTLRRLPAPESSYILLGIGDPQVTSLAQLDRFKNETLADITTLRQTTPADLPIYGIMLGDIVGDALHLHAPLRDIVNATPITTLSVIGNHDHDQAFSNLKQDGAPGATTANNKDYEAGESYENIYGPLNYSVNIGDTHIIALDNVLYTKQSGYGTGLTDEILEWVRQDLSFVPKTKTLIIAYHIPLRGSTTYQNAQALYNLLKDYAGVHLLAGHTHYQQNITFPITGSTKTITAYEHIHGGACGAWWASIVNTEGAPNGYGVYTISGAKITDWYSHPTGYSDTYQMRMYRGNATFGSATTTYTYGKTANDIVIDIWNSDTTGNWKFAVYENDLHVSSTLTKLARTVDAYAAGYHVGVLGRAAAGNYDAGNNNHLYLHTLRTPGPATRVEIRATDPFGKTYTLTDITTDLSEFPANYTSPAITTHPQPTITVPAGHPVTLTAAALATPPPTLTWQTSPDGATWTPIPGATAPTLTLPPATLQMDGTLYRLAATNLRGLATSAPALLTVTPDPALTAAQQLKTQLETPDTTPITITGTINLALVGGATLTTPKTILGADAAATITGTLTLATGADNTIIRGLNLTTGALLINGANDIHISHCTLTDAPVTITGGADNITLAWNTLTATPAAPGTAMTITNAGPATGIHLDHNHWTPALRADMPAVTNARVLMTNNLITATGNTTATIAGPGAQILSISNIYQNTHAPLATQTTGRLRALDNHLTATTGPTATGDDKVYAPPYPYATAPATPATAALIAANAGNTAGQNSPTPPQTPATATITATAAAGATTTPTAATIPAGSAFTLTATATGIVPTACQWYRDHFPIPGATAAAYTVAAAATDHAGAYTIALTAPTGELIHTAGFTITIAPPAPPPPDPPGGGSSSGGGGGGAPTLPFLAALATLAALSSRLKST